jgi:hypothetical protein
VGRGERSAEEGARSGGRERAKRCMCDDVVGVICAFGRKDAMDAAERKEREVVISSSVVFVRCNEENGSCDEIGQVCISNCVLDLSVFKTTLI